MPRLPRQAHAALVALCLLSGLGCGAPPAKVKLSIDLSDEAFCPRGVLADHPGKVESVDVRVGLRSRDGGPLKFEEELVLKVYSAAEPLEVLVRQTIPVSMQLGETWRRPLDIVEFVPPAKEGNYIAEVSSAEGGWASTRFGVWYDSAACPQPTTSTAVAGTPLVTAPVPTPPPTKASRKSPLQVALQARWVCNAEEGVEDLEVEVRVTNPASSGRALRGFRPVVQGIDELEPFERQPGATPGGYLAAGTHLDFKSFGWIETGSRAISVGVLGSSEPLLRGTLEVDCSGGAGAKGEARLPGE